MLLIKVTSHYLICFRTKLWCTCEDNGSAQSEADQGGRGYLSSGSWLAIEMGYDVCTVSCLCVCFRHLI